jgi:hypothetical protein
VVLALDWLDDAAGVVVVVVVLGVVVVDVVLGVVEVVEPELEPDDAAADVEVDELVVVDVDDAGDFDVVADEATFVVADVFVSDATSKPSPAAATAAVTPVAVVRWRTRARARSRASPGWG